MKITELFNLNTCTLEFEIIKQHSLLGHKMLSASTKDSHIISFIVSIADVFDALGNKSVYKDTCHIDQIFDFMKSESGKNLIQN